MGLSIKDLLYNLFVPRKRCVICGNPVQRHLKNFSYSKNEMHKRVLHLSNMCFSCKLQLYIPEEPFCSHCHKPLDENDLANDEGLCGDCSKESEKYLDKNRSMVLYNYFIKEKIALYKYRGQQSLSHGFSYLLKMVYDKYYSDLDIDLITYVPIHEIRLEERGFNQGERIAEELQRMTGISFQETLIKVNPTGKQSKKGKKERRKQIAGSLNIIEDIIPLINGKKILIVERIRGKRSVRSYNC